ncbi:MAG: ribosomal protein S18-alanine N-acetyltransferase [Lachnospiraceae bacterium]|nr:ribosomal protein S18-alanine N-acetyltransferase [Lachnospiraceae bacterium]
MIVIRRLEERDVEAVSVLNGTAFSMPWSPEDFRHLVADENSLYYVAEEDGRIVASLGVTNVLSEGNINNVVVEEACRGRGIATEMMELLFKEGDAMGITDYTLEVRVSNAPAIALYEKLGFVSEGIRPRFYERPTEDAMIMWRRKR